VVYFVDRGLEVCECGVVWRGVVTGEMEEDMNKLWEKFSLMEEEDEEVIAPEEEVEPVVERGSACVVGKLLADRTVGKDTIRVPLLRAW
jgi:hypothetical protein